MFNYNRKLSPGEVKISVCFNDSRSLYSTLPSSIKALSEQTGLRIMLSSLEHIPNTRGDEVLHHLICVDERPYNTEIVDQCYSLLEVFDTISIAFAYDSVNSMLDASDRIREFKQLSKDRLNFLRPDKQAMGLIIVSDEKIIDNIVCDTLRVKYSPRCTSESLSEGISVNALNFFDKASFLYSKYAMYHRSCTDGYFAMRTHHGFYVTATKTNKCTIDPSRISLVLDYHEEENTIFYAGRYLPSSDAVEAAIVFREIPEIDYLIHTHASHLFTRNPLYSERITVPRLPYGEPALGHQLSRALKASCDQFVIMDDHGEIFGGTSRDYEAFLTNIAKHCEQSLFLSRANKAVMR